MANTYTQLSIQLVFAVKGRDRLIGSSIREEVESYISGAVQNNGHKLLAIYCMPDHCHVLVGMNTTQSVADLMRDIKSNSSKFINEKGLTNVKFQWQEGYGAFSYSKSQQTDVVNYILNQPHHHKTKSFREEYTEFLQRFEVQYDERYLFDWI